MRQRESQTNISSKRKGQVKKITGAYLHYEKQ